jgi:hypothetical protein
MKRALFAIASVGIITTAVGVEAANAQYGPPPPGYGPSPAYGPSPTYTPPPRYTPLHAIPAAGQPIPRCQPIPAADRAMAMGQGPTRTP